MTGGGDGLGPRRRLSPAKRALFEQRLQAALLRTAATPQIPRTKDRSSPPLSFGQERLWFLQQWEPGSVVYNRPCVLRLTGSLDIGVLEHTLNEIVRRHESLRTCFPVESGRPRQCIVPEHKLALHLIDLGHLSASTRQAEADRLAQETIGQPFDLEKGPLVQGRLLRLCDAEHWLLLTLHHIVFDGWSEGVLERELTAIYQAFSAGRPSPLSELPVQYADYAVWQREWLQGEELDRQLAYWKKRLAGSSAILDLPTDFPRPAAPSSPGTRQELVLDQPLTQRLHDLSRQEGATLFMTLLAAFQVVLGRYVGQEDVVVAVPIAGRNRTELEGLLGLFVNTLILRTELSGRPTFRELMGRVRELTLQAYAHQDLPFEKLVEELNPPRLLDRHPWCDVLLNYADFPTRPSQSSEFECCRVDVNQEVAKFPLTLYVEPARELRLRLVYRRDLFSDARMRAFLEQFQFLLRQIVEEPDRHIGDYSLLTPESRSVLPDPRGELEEPHFPPVTSIFLNWIEQTPDQIAVSQGEHSWTYLEAGERAGRLARLLRAHGIQPGDVVAIQGPRSFGTIISALGVLLSGGVLLLVDRNLPRRRKELMLQEAEPKALISVGTDPQERDWFGTVTDIPRFELEPATGHVAGFDDLAGLRSNPLPRLSPDDPAYLFFTSGTTGVPKGIVGCHKGLAHFLHWQRTEFAIGPDDRVAQLTSLSFDVVLRDIFLPLTSGGTICLPITSASADASRVFPWLQQEKITVLHAVPSLANFWLGDAATDFALPGLRYVFFAGEPLTDALVGRWRHAVSNECTIVNLYGPTETTLAKCYYRVPVDPLPGVQPIGKALPQTQALVLADHNRLCGIAEAGEIVLRTPFRTLGYLKSTDRNGFITNPFREDNADWLYFTGDRGRFRADGTLEILGRFDDQIKIHGVRIQPSEIAAILNGHAAVQACVVQSLARENAALAVYVVLGERSGVSIAELRSYLAERFPVTAASLIFTLLDRLPLTPNGKVDRKALPLPAFDRLDPEDAYVAPQTPIEALLASIWGNLLGVKQVGIHDNFFDLGGHSLLATRLVSQVRRALNLEFPLRAIFEMPTIARLALCLLERQSKVNRPQAIETLLGELESITEESAERQLLAEESTQDAR